MSNYSTIKKVGINSLGLNAGKLTVSSTEVYKNRRTTDAVQTNNLNDFVTALYADAGFAAWMAGNNKSIANYPYTGVTPTPETLQAITISRTSSEFVLEFDHSLLLMNPTAATVDFCNMCNLLALNPEYDSLDDLDDTATGLFDLQGYVYLDQNKATLVIQAIDYYNNGSSTGG